MKCLVAYLVARTKQPRANPRLMAIIVALCALSIDVARLRAEWAFVEGSMYVQVADELFPISAEQEFGPVSSFTDSLFLSSGLGSARAGVSATPQGIKSYASASVPTAFQLVGGSLAGVTAGGQEKAILTFPEDQKSAPALTVAYRLTGNLSVAGSGNPNDPDPLSHAFDTSFADMIGSIGVDFHLPGEQQTFVASQVGDGWKSFDEIVSGQLFTVSTSDPRIWEASWSWGLGVSVHSISGIALASSFHTFEFSTLTFANGQSLEDFGVSVRFESGGNLPPDLAVPPEFGGGGSQPVPEPATLTMLATGAMSMLGLFAIRRRRGAVQR